MMPAQAFLRTVQTSLPSIRLGSFRKESNESADLVLARYAWNVELCEAMYPALHYFEIGLRNNLDAALQAKVRIKEWYNRPGILERDESDSIEHAMDQIIKSRKAATHDRIIAELSMGFWINLFSNKYEEKLWSSGDALKLVFPLMPKYKRKTNTIGKELESIRSFRNRVFHHEPIWKIAINEMHLLIISYINFINPGLPQLTKQSCRLSAVWNDGIKPIDFSKLVGPSRPPDSGSSNQASK